MLVVARQPLINAEISLILVLSGLANSIPVDEVLVIEIGVVTICRLLLLLHLHFAVSRVEHAQLQLVHLNRLVMRSELVGLLGHALRLVDVLTKISV